MNLFRIWLQEFLSYKNYLFDIFASLCLVWNDHATSGFAAIRRKDWFLCWPITYVYEDLQDVSPKSLSELRCSR
jgi:hypothetical protein